MCLVHGRKFLIIKIIYKKKKHGFKNNCTEKVETTKFWDYNYH